MKMATIKELAQNFDPKNTKNITELKTVSTDMAVFEESGKDQDGKKFTYKFIEINGEHYRIPGSVLLGLKQILEKKPTLKNFAVTKTGEGLKTRYQVIPLD